MKPILGLIIGIALMLTGFLARHNDIQQDTKNEIIQLKQQLDSNRYILHTWTQDSLFIKFKDSTNRVLFKAWLKGRYEKVW